MAHTIIMPKLGQTVEESTIVKWHKKVGDVVAKGDVLFEIETDKAVLEIESFFDGTLLAIIVPEGGTVPVTAPVGFIGAPGEKIPDVPPPAKPKPVAAPAAVSVSPSPAAAPAAAVPAAATTIPTQAVPPPAARHRFSPRARRLLRELPIDPNAIPDIGRRMTEKDVCAWLETSGYNQLRITPAAKALALREKINILEAPRGADGGVGVDEVKVAIAERPTPMSTMRQVIARRMLQSTSTMPHFFVTVAADVTELLALRKELKKAGKNYSLNDFVIKAAALALREFPQVNSTTDGKTARWHSRINIGMAVALPDGLVVPVIRDADKISLAELHDQAAQLALRARDGKLAPDDMTGGTFTVSNMGMLDVENFTAIINPGESAILAVASVLEQPTARKETIVIRSIMKMTVSSDHRLIDGAVAARFINRIRKLLEDVELWKSMT